jgi:hypothetical protein
LSECLCFVDNDILKKLVTYQLFARTVQTLQLFPEDIRILTTAKFRFEKNWKKVQTGKNRRPDEKVIRYPELLQVCEKLTKITESDIDIDLLTMLNLIDDIDVGEALLTAAFLKSISVGKSAWLLTGDNRFIKALASVKLPVMQEQQLRGRILCLEQIILMNINAMGFEMIKENIVPVRDCDQAMKAAFGSGRQSTSENVRITLNGYIDDLRQASGQLLFGTG